METKKLVRWPYLLMGFVIFLFIGLIYAWSIFVVPLERAFGWLRSDTSNVFSVVLVFFSLGSLAGGFMAKKFSVKFIVRLSALLLMAGFVLSSRVTALWQFYITYAVMCSTGVGMCYTSVAGAVAKWFPDKTGTANGTLFVGFGLANMVLGGLVNSILMSAGWSKTFFMLGIAFGVILIAAVHKLDVPADDIVFPQPSVKRKSVTVFPDRDYTTGETMRRATFWKIFVWAMFLCAAAYAVIGSVSPAVVSIGAMLSFGALATGFVSVCNGGSRVLWGAMYDRLGMRITIMTVCAAFVLGSAVAIASVAAGSIVGVCIAFMCIGFGFGGVPTVASTTINKMYGKKNYSANFSVYMLTCIPAAFLGPALSGVLVTASGSYFSTFCVMLAASIIGTIIAITIKNP